MKIPFMDALDAFSNGGYIDLETGKYIAPKWFSELCPENSTGLSAEDYRAIAQNPKRYLKPPVFSTCGIRSIAAMKLGMTRGELVKAGMVKDEYWNIFCPDYDRDISPRCNDEEWEVAKKVDEYIEEKYMVVEHVEIMLEIGKKYMEEWLARYQIEIC